MDQQATLEGLSLRERSEFFRGLLLVMAADGELHDAERELIKHAISPFDFSAEFVDESIESILKNKHVSQVPPHFESQANSHLFLRAALDIAFADGVLDETEEKWLRATADINGIAAEWLEEQIAERE
ncbi:MAG TPA: TerB family tellurite resistance protein [Turneriella sp.]|nr:TerB family tellurite resistance protein [Turneriella sp.]HNL08972.1 TerB family tellurite resistance protein [Turneriella sp.]HNL55523.1 TerB family tellurite resistance protein [Turneriella sp.]